MNLRQQFFWKILLGLSVIVILVSSLKTYYKYLDFKDIQDQYADVEIRGMGAIKGNIDFILKDYENRKDYYPSINTLSDNVITDHLRANLSNNAELVSNDPIYEASYISNGKPRARITYSGDKGSYGIGDKLKGKSNWTIIGIDENKIVFRIDYNDGEEHTKIIYQSNQQDKKNLEKN